MRVLGSHRWSGGTYVHDGLYKLTFVPPIGPRVVHIINVCSAHVTEVTSELVVPGNLSLFIP